jgi:hypothetical protein
MTKHVALRKANLHVLASHHLTPKTRSTSIVRTVDDVVALHSTCASTPYISLFARMQEIAKKSFERALYARRSLGRIRCMRRTMHVVSRKMLPVAFSATRGLVAPRLEQYLRHVKMSRKSYDRIAKAIVEAVGGGGLSAAEVKKEVGPDPGVTMILNILCDRGVLVRGEPRGGWTSSVHTYHPFGALYPEVDLAALDEDDACAALARSYLSAFGPASFTDLAWWAGWRKTQTRKALEALGGEVASVDVEGAGRELLILGKRLEALRSKKPGKARVVSVLPVQDPLLMGYKERARYLDPANHDFVFDGDGNATSTILVDGRAAGVWDFEPGPEPQIKLLLFGRPGRALRAAIAEEAGRVGRFMADTSVDIVEKKTMIPLKTLKKGAFMSPLRHPA